MAANDPHPGSRLDQISTRQAAVRDPEQFLLRYGTAIRAYLVALLGRADLADEVAQEVMLSVVRGVGPAAWKGLGRFRDYLKTVIRNAAFGHLRKSKGKQAETLPEDVSDRGAAMAAADRVWDAEWHRCVMSRVWRELETHERRNPGNLFYSVLRQLSTTPEADSIQIARDLSKKIGKTVSPEAYRKQLSRARRFMAELITVEVADTLGNPSANEVESELIEVGLWPLVRDYLPTDWKNRIDHGAA